MQPSETYFFRSRGEWNWRVNFEVTSWFALWTSELSFMNKIRLTAFMLSQVVFGPFYMWTMTDFKEGSNEVLHFTKIKKWGFTYMKSKKSFLLEPDGLSLRVEGVEGHWPITKRTSSFQPMLGSVDATATRATYQMPFMGISCACRTVLEPQIAEVYISTPWLQGQFSMTRESKNRLEERFSGAGPIDLKRASH